MQPNFSSDTICEFIPNLGDRSPTKTNVSTAKDPYMLQQSGKQTKFYIKSNEKILREMQAKQANERRQTAVRAASSPKQKPRKVIQMHKT